MLNDEAVRELDKDVARQYFKLNDLPLPDEKKETAPSILVSQ